MTRVGWPYLRSPRPRIQLATKRFASGGGIGYSNWLPPVIPRPPKVRSHVFFRSSSVHCLIARRPGGFINRDAPVRSGEKGRQGQGAEGQGAESAARRQQGPAGLAVPHLAAGP